MKEYGKKTWLIADCFYPAVSTVAKSHEAICVLNTGLKEAQITLTLYFEDAPKRVFRAVCPGERTHHIRMDKLVDENGEGVPSEKPYAVLVESTMSAAAADESVSIMPGELDIEASVVVEFAIQAQ